MSRLKNDEEPIWGMNEEPTYEWIGVMIQDNYPGWKCPECGWMIATIGAPKDYGVTHCRNRKCGVKLEVKP